MALFKIGGTDLNLKVVGVGARIDPHFAGGPPTLQGAELSDRERIDLEAFESAGWQFLSVHDPRLPTLERLDRILPDRVGLLARYSSDRLVVIESRIHLKLAPDASLESIGHRLKDFSRVEKLGFGGNLYEAYPRLTGPNPERVVQRAWEELFSEVQSNQDLLFAEPSILYHLDRSLRPSADQLGEPLARASDSRRGRFSIGELLRSLAVDRGDLDRVEQWHWKKIELKDAWEAASTHGEGVRVGVIDLGFGSHPQMGNVVWRVQVDERGVASTAAALPVDDHGIACAALIGALKDDLSVNGAAPGSELILVALVGTAPGLSPHRIVGPGALANAITVCAFGEGGEAGADVISCSLGLEGTGLELHGLVRDALADARQRGRGGRGTPIFWASFNENREISSGSLEGNEHLLCVSQSDRSDTRFESGFGDALDLLAPGTDVPVLGSDPSGWRVDPKTGSSLAAPCVAGVAALVLAVNDGLSADQVTRIIARSCDRPPGVDTRNRLTGWGRLNARKAVELALQVRNGVISLEELMLTTSPTPHLPPSPPPVPPVPPG